MYHWIKCLGHGGFEEMELSDIADLLTLILRINLRNILQVDLPQMLIKN